MTTNSLKSARNAIVSSAALFILLFAAARASAQALPAAPMPSSAPLSYNFSFGPQPAPPGATQVVAATVYSTVQQYGFEPGADVTCTAATAPAASGGFCTSDKPFFFSVGVPEGDYDVTFTFGDPQGDSLTTVKTESRRLLLEGVQTKAGEIVTRSFTINVHYPEIAGGGQVALKQREVGTMDWDHKLTFEFNNKRPAIDAITITKADHPITVYIPPSSIRPTNPGPPGDRCSRDFSSPASPSRIKPNRVKHSKPSSPKIASRRSSAP